MEVGLKIEDKEQQPKAVFTARIKYHTFRELRQYAEKNELSINKCVNLILEKYLKRDVSKRDISKRDISTSTTESVGDPVMESSTPDKHIRAYKRKGDLKG